MFRGRGLRDREHRSRTGKEAQRDLPRCHTTRLRDTCQHRASLAVACGKIVVAERRVCDDSDATLLAPRDHRMLDRALLEMIEHLIARDAAFAGDVENFVE